MNHNFKKIMFSLYCIIPLMTIASDQETINRDARNAALMLKIYPVVQKLNTKNDTVWKIIQQYNPGQLSDGFAMEEIFPLEAPELYHTTGANFMSFSPNESQVAIVKGKKVSLCDAQTRADVVSFDHDTEDSISEVNFSTDGVLLLTACKNICRIWDIDKKDLVASITPDCATFSNASFSAAGDQFAVETNAGVQVFQASSGKHLKTFENAKYYQFSGSGNGIFIEQADGKKESYGVQEEEIPDDEYKKKGAQTKKIIFTKLADLNKDFVVQKDNKQPKYEQLFFSFAGRHTSEQYTKGLSIDTSARTTGCEGAVIETHPVYLPNQPHHPKNIISHSYSFHHPFGYIRYKDRYLLWFSREVNYDDKSFCYFSPTGRQIVVKTEFDSLMTCSDKRWLGKYAVSDISLLSDPTFVYYANGNLMPDQELLLLLLKEEQNGNDSRIDLDEIARKKSCDVQILKKGLDRFSAIYKNKIVEVYNIYTDEQKEADKKIAAELEKQAREHAAQQVADGAKYAVQQKKKKDSATCLVM